MPDPQNIHAAVWHAHTLASPVQAVHATGEALLDAHLPGGGWPVGALVELLQPAGVHCEWRLLLPALAGSGSGSVGLVAPPQLPFVPALIRLGLGAGRMLAVQSSPEQRLWTTEQLLRCADVDAVLAWLPQARGEQLRRLQMAASEYQKLLFVMRPARARSDASPAVLRLMVQPLAQALEVQILKRRGPPLAQALQLQACHSRLLQLLAAHGADKPGAAPVAPPPPKTCQTTVPCAPPTGGRH
jgi:protein ImuA